VFSRKRLPLSSFPRCTWERIVYPRSCPSRTSDVRGTRARRSRTSQEAERFDDRGTMLGGAASVYWPRPPPGGRRLPTAGRHSARVARSGARDSAGYLRAARGKVPLLEILFLNTSALAAKMRGWLPTAVRRKAVRAGRTRRCGLARATRRGRRRGARNPSRA
jgi:hypothetical protein